MPVSNITYLKPQYLDASCLFTFLSLHQLCRVRVGLTGKQRFYQNNKEERGAGSILRIDFPGRTPGTYCAGTDTTEHHCTTTQPVHFITSNSKSLEKKGLATEVGLKGRACATHWGILYGTTRSSFIDHHSINTERSIPSNRRVNNVPLDDTLMVLADDFLSSALALALALGPVSDALLKELLAAVSCWKHEPRAGM